MNVKCLLIMLDGIADRSHAILGHKTPLQKAKTPALDRLARLGCSGMYHPGLRGQVFPGETAQLIIFGYDMEDIPGRGPLEALGAEIPLAKSDVVAMARLACAEEKEGMLVLRDGKPDIGNDQLRELYDTVKHYSRKGINVGARQIKGIHGVIMISGEMSPHITDSDPFSGEKPVRMVQAWSGVEDATRAAESAELVNSYLRWAYHALSASPVNVARKKAGQRPVNVMVTQRAGRLKQVAPVRERYGLRSLCISSSTIRRGMASYIGMDHAYSPAMPPPEDVSVKVQLALEKFAEYDFIHVHTGEQDDSASSKDPGGKARMIEDIDRGIKTMLPSLLKRDDLIIVVMAENPLTSGEPLILSGEPVPVIFCGHGVRRDRVRHYDEISASQGALGLMRGKEIMLEILNCMGRSAFAGLRESPVEIPYRPGKSSPLKITHD